MRSFISPLIPTFLLTLAASGCVVVPGGGTEGSSSSTSSASDSSTGSSSGSTGGSSSGGSSGSATEAMTSSTGASTGSSSGSSGGASSSTGVETGGPVSCGGKECGGGEYCDWTGNSCGDADWDEGACMTSPDACDQVYAPVCGCDGEVYSNACMASAAGVDVADGGGCTAPEGYFPCGYAFCDGATEYCQVAVSDVFPLPDTYSCLPLPELCQKELACPCLDGEPCFEFECKEENGGLTLICPGG